MGEAIGAIFILFFASICGFVYWGYFFYTRDKLENEDFKLKFLEEQFIYLIGSLKGNNEITHIRVWYPKSKNKPWKVTKTVKSGSWPSGETNGIVIFLILDKDLESTETYKKAILSFTNDIKIDASFSKEIETDLVINGDFLMHNDSFDDSAECQNNKSSNFKPLADKTGIRTIFFGQSEYMSFTWWFQLFGWICILAVFSPLFFKI